MQAIMRTPIAVDGRNVLDFSGSGVGVRAVGVKGS